MGVRMALGARSWDLWRLVVGQSLRPVALGLLAGIIGALAVGRVLSSLLFQVSPRDPSTIAAVSTALLLVAIGASSIPARRAALIAPLDALRDE